MSLPADIHDALHRPNVRRTVADKRSAFWQLKAFLGERHAGEPGIVYCLTRKRAEEVAGKLRDEGFVAEACHSATRDEERARMRDAFLSGELQVVVVTDEAGAEIDKPDVRFVVHYDLPKSIEVYCRQIGQAGRDGKPAEALFLFGHSDATAARKQIDHDHSPEQAPMEHHKLAAVVAFGDATTCRQRVLLGYFGEPADDDCGACDLCLDPPPVYDGTIEAQQVLSAVHGLEERFGIAHVVDVVRGSANMEIVEYGHRDLPAYGTGARHTKAQWETVVRQLIHLGYLTHDFVDGPVLRLTPLSVGVIHGSAEVRLVKGRRKTAEKRPERREVAGAEVDEGLFERLRELRAYFASEKGVPSYAVFADSELASIAAARPQTHEELLKIAGVSPVKVKRYGEDFVGEIVAWARERAAG